MTYEQKLAQAKQNLQASIDQLAVYEYENNTEKIIEHAAILREVRKRYFDIVQEKPKLKVCGNLRKTCSALGNKNTCNFAGECVFQCDKSWA